MIKNFLMFLAWRISLAIVPASIALHSGWLATGWVWLVLLGNAFMQGMILAEYMLITVGHHFHDHTQAQEVQIDLGPFLEQLKQKMKEHSDKLNHKRSDTIEKKQQKDDLPG